MEKKKIEIPKLLPPSGSFKRGDESEMLGWDKLTEEQQANFSKSTALKFNEIKGTHIYV